MIVENLEGVIYPLFFLPLRSGLFWAYSSFPLFFMQSLEKQKSSSLPRFFGTGAMVDWLWGSLAQKSGGSELQKNSNGEQNFYLIDTFVSELIRAQVETPVDLETDRRNALERTLYIQLEAALREHIRMPYHSDANEIDWGKYAAGDLHVIHRNYGNQDIRTQGRRAVAVSSGQKKERYARETKQLDTLYEQKILPELEDLSQLAETTAEMLSLEIRSAYGLSAQEPVFVGQKHALVMPANKEVYADGFSYINIHQLVYIPRLQKLLVTLDQYYAEISFSQHAQVFSHWKDSTVQGKELTEDLLMKTLPALPEEVRFSPAFEVFLGAARVLEESENDIPWRQKQQYSLSLVEQRRSTLEIGATFLTQVLLTEYQVCRKFPQALSSLSQRLQVAFEMVAHPLLSGRNFSYQASLQSYSDQFLKQWLFQSSKLVATDVFLLEKLENPEYSRQARTSLRSDSFLQQRDKALLQLSKTYPEILGSFLSQAQCATGSLGGLSRLTSSLRSTVLRGEAISFSQLQSIVGSRAEKFSPGECINPKCKAMKMLEEFYGSKETIPRDKLPYCGECRLCITCEVEYQENQAQSANDGATDNLREFGNNFFGSTEDVVSDYLGRFPRVSAELLPSFFIAGDRVLH